MLTMPHLISEAKVNELEDNLRPDTAFVYWLNMCTFGAVHTVKVPREENCRRGALCSAGGTRCTAYIIQANQPHVLGLGLAGFARPEILLPSRSG